MRHYLNDVPDIFMGISVTSAGETIASIALTYPTKTRGTFIAVAREMDRLSCVPRICVTKSEVLILFDLNPFTETFASSAFPGVPVGANDNLLFLAEGTNFEIAIVPFMRQFRESGSFVLSMMGTGVPTEVLWQKTLESISHDREAFLAPLTGRST